MAGRRRRPDGRQDEEQREAERPLDSGTVQALREADPRSRAQTILELQRRHGNAAVQRAIRSLQGTAASRDARIQMIGERAEEPVPSGRLERAALYREAIEAELDAAPLAAQSERELVRDSVNTIGQIFANYQAALHQFEAAVEHGAGEAVPRELAREVLRAAARDVFEPVLRAAAETAGELAEQVEEGVGVTAEQRAEAPREPGASAPAFALRNLLVAERRRLAATQMRLLAGQVALAERAGEDAGRRDRLLGATIDLNKLERTTHSPAGILKAIMDRYRDAAKGRAEVRIVLDADWRVVSAHIAAPHGAALAAQLLADHGGRFDLGDLHLPRHVTWQPAELATCQAILDARGVPRRFDRNEKGGAYFDEFERRLRTDGLPGTRVLTGD